MVLWGLGGEALSGEWPSCDRHFVAGHRDLLGERSPNASVHIQEFIRPEQRAAEASPRLIGGEFLRGELRTELIEGIRRHAEFVGLRRRA